jgi:hypothetical protein
MARRKQETLLEIIDRLNREAAEAAAAAPADDASPDPWELLSLDEAVAERTWKRWGLPGPPDHKMQRRHGGGGG